MPTIKIHNAETNEVIERDMTEAELTEYESKQAIEMAFLEEMAAKEAARQALLDRLGITAEEAALLLG